MGDFVLYLNACPLISFLVDQSIPVVKGDHLSQLRVGTLEHILDMAKDPKGAIINVMSFPLPLSAVKKDKLSSEIEAWSLTKGSWYCAAKATYPTAKMRWGLASTAGARHWTHIDCDGLATFIDLICGGKWWILFRPKLTARVDLFLNFDPAVVESSWDAEAVFLTPGTRLYVLLVETCTLLV